jgi:hypothetical protein
MFTASESRGRCSTHVSLYMLAACDVLVVVRKPVVPQWDRSGKYILIYFIIASKRFNRRPQKPNAVKSQNSMP